LDVLKTISNALTQPVFDYCDAVWGNLNKGLANKIQKLQNRAARVITFQGYDTRSEDLLQFLSWDNLALRRNKRLCLLMCDTINRKVSQYLSDLFPLTCESNPYKSRLRENILKIKMAHVLRTESFKSSFSIRGAKLWNSLPLNVESAKSKAIFRKNLTDCQAVA